MNLGFFINSTSQNQLNSEIFSLLNDSVEKDEITDATVFYNEIDFNPLLNSKKFGLFNATEMWSFTGTLVVTSLGLLPLSKRVVNKIKLIYLYSKENFEYGNTSAVLDLISTNDVAVIAKSDEDAKEYKRLTGKEVKVVKPFNAKEILGV